MATLSKDLRNKLLRVTLAAREAAEEACRAALENLAVHEKDYRGHMTVEQRELRNRLRARGRALGDALDASKGTQAITRLTEDAAYEHWNRLLFTRFLADNGLLHADEARGNVPVTLEDCEELAPELGAKDGFDLACRFAEHILPGVFRSKDPVFEIPLARKDQVKLRELLDSLPLEVFTADDSLGWTYQFWQEKRKDEVNRSGKKIGAEEISPVTQLFTEDYMVEFLLHNTLGAWWAAKLGPIVAISEEDARAKTALSMRDGLAVNWNYLRFVQDEESKSWSPAAGTFDRWPRTAKGITFLDPCMGSGHFPTAALRILARIRMEEEKLSAKEAVSVVLEENIFGLELDPRCTQIGAFNLALTAWRVGGYNLLPQIHVACCGLAPQAKLNDWIALSGDDEKLQNGMKRLYELFKQAPVLGSLIDPRSGKEDLYDATFHELQPLLERAMAQETKDESSHEMAITALGVAKAAEILAHPFTLIATNVPYLAHGKQTEVLSDFCELRHPAAKADLATCFVERGLRMCEANGTISFVMPQNCLAQDMYGNFRRDLLKQSTWRVAAQLGAGAFRGITGEVVKPLLLISGREKPTLTHHFFGADVTDFEGADPKSNALKNIELSRINQAAQIANPKSRISFNKGLDVDRLSKHAFYSNGVQTGDLPRFSLFTWELAAIANGWACKQTTVDNTCLYGGMVQALYWQDGDGDLVEFVREKLESENTGAWLRGKDAWGKRGVLVSAMGSLQVSLYLGDFFDDNTVAVVPKNEALLPAVWALCSDESYHDQVRAIDKALKVRGPLVEVPFDLAHWEQAVTAKYPDGLPKPFSSDPTQWIFNGHPERSDQPLHVAVARLLGYRWPRQTGSSFPDCPAIGLDGIEAHADDDGIVALPPLNREQPAAGRLRALLAMALGSFDEKSLLSSAGKNGSKSKTFEDWLRDEFFEQHCDLFNQRPFIWHIWDGRKDGFAALVNYHKFDYGALQKLTYSYLGTWIHDQEADAKADKPGAAERLEAAQNLQSELVKILDGEAPYDIFVRWKPIQKQTVGWNPDLNYGVRLNIRPFLTAKDVGKKDAGILRTKPNIKWEKDRGSEPQRSKDDFPWFWCEEEPGTDPTGGKNFTGHRWNNVHLTLAKKQAAKK